MKPLQSKAATIRSELKAMQEIGMISRPALRRANAYVDANLTECEVYAATMRSSEAADLVLALAKPHREHA